MITKEEEIKCILEEYDEFGLYYVIWRNDTPYPKGTRITLNDLSNNDINKLIERYSKCKCVSNDTHILIFQDAILKKRELKIKKLKKLIKC